MRFAQKLVLSLSLIFLVQGCQPQEAAEPELVSLETIEDKAFYGMGVAMAKMADQQMAAFEPTEEERSLVIEGFTETYGNDAPRVDLEAINSELEAWAQGRLETAQLAKMTPEERAAARRLLAEWGL